MNFRDFLKWLQWERPIDENIAKMARVLGVRPEWLVHGQGPKKAPAQKERFFVNPGGPSVSVNVLVPPDLYNDLVRATEKSNRPISVEIIARLRGSFRKDTDMEDTKRNS